MYLFYAVQNQVEWFQKLKLSVLGGGDTLSASEWLQLAPEFAAVRICYKLFFFDPVSQKWRSGFDVYTCEVFGLRLQSIPRCNWDPQLTIPPPVMGRVINDEDEEGMPSLDEIVSMNKLDSGRWKKKSVLSPGVFVHTGADGRVAELEVITRLRVSDTGGHYAPGQEDEYEVGFFEDAVERAERLVAGGCTRCPAEAGGSHKMSCTATSEQLRMNVVEI